ncbi:MAG: caspase family protein [Chitinophagaceae bacterium]
MNVKKCALVVGIDNYTSSPLASSINDAAAIAGILQTNADNSPNFHVKTANNIKHRTHLIEAIEELFSKEMDVSLFYFSGHGYLDQTGGYIVTPDAKKYEMGVSMEMILGFVNRSPARSKIVILDCCHSGAFGERVSSQEKNSYLADGVTILTASRKSESAMGTTTLSVFTRLLLEALKGGAAEIAGYITLGTIYSYIDQALGPWHQRPVFKTNVSNFVVLRTETPSIPINVLRQITVYFTAADQVYQLDPTYEHTNTDVAIPAKVAIFQDLKKMQTVGLLTVVEETELYWAAQHSTGCRLTALGMHYWRLINDYLL